MARPLLYVRFCRNYRRRGRGFVLTVVLAPFPDEEQEQGAEWRALMNLQVEFMPHWPFVNVYCYAADRLAGK